VLLLLSPSLWACPDNVEGVCLPCEGGRQGMVMRRAPSRSVPPLFRPRHFHAMFYARNQRARVNECATEGAVDSCPNAPAVPRVSRQQRFIPPGISAVARVTSVLLTIR